MELIGASGLRTKTHEAKRIKVSREDLKELVDRKVLISFEGGESFPIVPSIDLACQVLKPGSVSQNKEWDDSFGLQLLRYWQIKCLRKCHLLRFEEKAGLFVDLDKLPSYLVQLLLQELSFRRLRKNVPILCKDENEELGFVCEKIDQFEISVVLPKSLCRTAGRIIKALVDSFTPSINTLVTLWFHGAKSQALGPIITTLRYTTPPQGAILDIFAGSCAVSSKLANYRRTITNDVEEFSAEIANALSTQVDSAFVESHLDAIHKLFEENRKKLEAIFKSHIDQEEWLLWGPVTHETVQKYQHFVNQYPVYSDDRQQWHLAENECVPWEKAVEDVSKRRINSNTIPYCLLTYYFANAYFGLKQAIELDSIRYAIDQILCGQETNKDNMELRSLLIAGLLSVASTMSSTQGHFAEYQRKFSVDNARKTWTKRREKIAWDLFCERVKYFAAERPPYLTKSYRNDWPVALAKCDEDSNAFNVATVYADPPMSDFQYSRFYHVLNTILKYDYPKSLGRGLYREGRFMSRFSSRANAHDEMRQFVKSVSQRDKTIVFSYKFHGLVALNDLYSLVMESYSDTLILSYNVVHSSQGRKRSKTPARTSEILFLGRNCQDLRKGKLISDYFTS